MTDRTGPVRLALMGLGEAARHVHLPACQQLPRVHLAGGADPDPSARAGFAKLAPKLPLYDDPLRLLEAERPDWVIVGTPPFAHRDLCLLALEHGAHVFCEKPFVEQLEDADLVIEAADRAGRAVAVNHEFRRMPIFEAARRMIGSEPFGKLLFLQAWEHVHERPEESRGWRSSGRTMREFGTHVVDLAVQFFGELPESVFARMPRPLEMGGADLIDVVILEFPGDRVASIVLDRVCRGPHHYLEMRLDGERASLRSSIGGRASLTLHLSRESRRPGARLEWAAGGQTWLEVGERRRVLARNPWNAFASATARHLSEVIDAVSRGAPPPCSARDARGVVAVVEAAYASAHAGKPVRISPSAAQPRLTGRTTAHAPK